MKFGDETGKEYGDVTGHFYFQFRCGLTGVPTSKHSKFSKGYRQKWTHCVTTGTGCTSPEALTGASVEAGADLPFYQTLD